MGLLARRFLLLSVLVGASQAFLGHQLAERSFPWRDQLDERLRSGPDVLFFGDSSSIFINNKDADRRNLTEMLRDALEDRRLAVLAYPAFHLQLYDALVCHVARQPARPRLLIIPVNLRSFSHEWHTRPEYQFRGEQLRLRLGDTLTHTLLRPASVLRIYPLNPLRQDQYLELPVRRGSETIGRVRDFTGPYDPQRHSDQLRDQCVFRYGYRLEADHPKLAALEALGRRAKRAGIRVLFYVTPVDVEAGDLAAGPSWTEGLKANVERIRAAAVEAGAEFLDLSSLLASRDFDWEGAHPNEHLKEEGRRRLTARLADAVRKLP